jgi:large subunit ribosomal protein L9
MNMKVILNKDIATLGEEGDVKEVAKGYARNFLFPRGFALPYTDKTIRLFEARKEEIAERKQRKRQDADSVRERLEALSLAISMPAGANGKLYGAVTSLSIAEELGKHGFEIERKRIDVPGHSIKSVGKYKVSVRLYGNAAAELFVSVLAQEEKAAPKEPHPRDKRKPAAVIKTPGADEAETPASVSTEAETPVSEMPVAETPASETPVSEAPASETPSGAAE